MKKYVRLTKTVWKITRTFQKFKWERNLIIIAICYSYIEFLFSVSAYCGTTGHCDSQRILQIQKVSKSLHWGFNTKPGVETKIVTLWLSLFSDLTKRCSILDTFLEKKRLHHHHLTGSPSFRKEVLYITSTIMLFPFFIHTLHTMLHTNYFTTKTDSFIYTSKNFNTVLKLRPQLSSMIYEVW